MLNSFRPELQRGRPRVQAEAAGIFTCGLFPSTWDSDFLARAFSSVCLLLCVKCLLGNKCIREGSGLEGQGGCPRQCEGPVFLSCDVVLPAERRKCPLLHAEHLSDYTWTFTSPLPTRQDCVCYNTEQALRQSPDQSNLAVNVKRI